MHVIKCLETIKNIIVLVCFIFKQLSFFCFPEFYKVAIFYGSQLKSMEYFENGFASEAVNYCLRIRLRLLVYDLNPNMIGVKYSLIVFGGGEDTFH